MVAEVVEYLAPGRGGLFVDCTVGLGGHARALLEAGATRVIGLDRDPAALARAQEVLAAWSDRIELVHSDYRDLNRTLHGLAQLPDAVKLSTRASAEVRSALVELATSAGVSTQAGFDTWHRDACAHLCALYAEHGFPLFCVGTRRSGSTWRSSTFTSSAKSVYVASKRLYGFGHVPLDRVMLNQLREHGAPPLSSPWSRLLDYGEYMELHRWIHRRFPASAPLAIEFHLWQAPRS